MLTFYIIYEKNNVKFVALESVVKITERLTRINDSINNCIRPIKNVASLIFLSLSRIFILYFLEYVSLNNRYNYNNSR